MKERIGPIVFTLITLFMMAGVVYLVATQDPPIKHQYHIELISPAGDVQKSWDLKSTIKPRVNES